MDPQPPITTQRRRHLISIADLDRAAVERIMETAAGFESVMQRDVKKVPTLRGRTVMNVFFESSTRTSSSFELAAKRLSPDSRAERRWPGRSGTAGGRSRTTPRPSPGHG